MNENYEQDLKFIIPINYNEPGNVLLGLLNTKRLIQCIPMAVPIAITFLLRIQIWAKVILTVIWVIITIFGIVGYKEMGLVEFTIMLFRYIRSDKDYSMKRLEGKRNAKKRKERRKYQKTEKKQKK